MLSWQAEVAHHANGCPEYFCSRPERSVHLYKKALAIDVEKHKVQTQRSSDDAEADWREMDEDGMAEPGVAASTPGDVKAAKSLARKLATKPSDLELYERRTSYWFKLGCEVSEALPAQATPEAQVANANLYDFFRLVHFHGGKQPYLSWHAEDEFPIVIMSLVLKLAEGPIFAFGARWALMQYHVWHNRNEILDASDADVKLRFRKWTNGFACPWHIHEDYANANRST